MSDVRWTDVIQSVGVMAALLFTASEMWRRRHEQRFQNYLMGIGRFADLARLIVERPELRGLYDYVDVGLPESYANLTPDDKAKVNYCDAVIALCETVWLASEEGWVAEDEWKYWRAWAIELRQSPYFRWSLKWVGDDYDKRFLALLAQPAAETRALA
jgi:hypothetical protein